MPLPRRRLRSTAVLVGTALCATLPSITATHAATPAEPTVSLTVNGQAPGTTPTTVSGVVNVAATITPVPGAPIQVLRYGIVGRPSNGGEILTTAGQCDSTCTIDFSIDTTVLKGYATGGSPVPLIPDGSHTLTVVASSAVDSGSAATALTVDNHRPQAGVPTSASQVVQASRTVTWTVQPSVSPTAPSGTTISDVELESPGTGLPITHFTKNADGSWTVQLDASALPSAALPVAAVATDSNGVVSAPLLATVALDNGFTLTAPQMPAVVQPTGWDHFWLSYANAGWAPCGQFLPKYGAGVTDVKLEVDGAVWQDLPVNAATLPMSYANGAYSCTLTFPPVDVPSVKPLPFGKHTLTFVATDSNGLQATAAVSTTVALPLTSNWPTGNEVLTAGGTIHLTPTVSSPDGSSTLQSWSITEATGTTLASGTGTIPPSLTLATSATQETRGDLFLNLVSNLGLTSTQGFTFQTLWPTATFARTSAASIAKGGWVELSADLWERVAGTWVHNPAQYGTVQWQWALPGSTVWHNGSVVGVEPQHPVASGIWTRPGGSACYRTVYSLDIPPAQGPSPAPVVSTPVCVNVEP